METRFGSTPLALTEQKTAHWLGQIRTPRRKCSCTLSKMKNVRARTLLRVLEVLFLSFDISCSEDLEKGRVTQRHNIAVSKLQTP